MKSHSEKLHILLIIEHFNASLGGAEAFAVMMMRLMATRGHRISILASTGDGDEQLSVHIVQNSDISKKIDELEPDLVINWGLTFPADLHRLGGGVHQQFLRYNLHAYNGLPRIFKKINYRYASKHRQEIAAEFAILNRPNAHFLAVSNFVAEQVRATVDIKEEYLHLLHNGVNLARFSYDKIKIDRKKVRKQLGLKDDDIASLFIAHNLKLKNLKLLEDIFSKLPAEFANLKLVLVGKRDPKIDAPWFIYGGSTNKPEKFYAACDLLLHPTFFDACANVVLEASVAGLPIITSSWNGSAEVIEKYQTGIVLPVDTPDARKQWTAALCELATNCELRKKFIERAKQITPQLSIENYANKFEKLIIDLANQKKNL